jgi:hypothetical protein
MSWDNRPAMRMACPQNATVLREHIAEGFFCLVLDSDSMLIERGVKAIIASGNLDQSTALGQHEVAGLLLLCDIADNVDKSLGLEEVRRQFNQQCECRFTDLDVTFFFMNIGKLAQPSTARIQILVAVAPRVIQYKHSLGKTVCS